MTQDEKKHVLRIAVKLDQAISKLYPEGSVGDRLVNPKLSILEDMVDFLHTCIAYTQFDLEATRREKNSLGEK